MIQKIRFGLFPLDDSLQTIQTIPFRFHSLQKKILFSNESSETIRCLHSRTISTRTIRFEGWSLHSI